MKTTTIIIKRSEFQYTVSESDPLPVYSDNTSLECHHVDPMERKEDPAEERSEMPVTSEENAQAKTPDPKEHKTPRKKVVLAIVLVIIAIIAACTANTPLVNDMLTKLVEIL